MRLVFLNNYRTPEKTQATLQSLSGIVGEKLHLEDYRTRDLYERIMNSQNQPDLLILSGSGHMLTKPENQKIFRPEMDIIRDAEFPIVGICYGHQLIGKTFGARLVDRGQTFRGFERVKILHDNPLFEDLPDEIRVPESHRQALASVPSEFDCLAESASSKVEVIGHKTRPIYGLQFHPERADDQHPDGRVLLQNAVRLSLKS